MIQKLSEAISAGLSGSAAFDPIREKSEGPWAALDEVARLRSALQEIARFRAMTLQPSPHDAIGWSLIALTLEQLANNALNHPEEA